MTRRCLCVTQHVPEAHVLNRHHILPKSWGGPDVPENLVDLCPNTHENVHKLLDQHVRLGGIPSWEYRRRFSVYARDLAARAWEQRPPKPTYTLKDDHVDV